MPSKVRASRHGLGGGLAHGALRGSGQGLRGSQEWARRPGHFRGEAQATPARWLRSAGRMAVVLVFPRCLPARPLHWTVWQWLAGTRGGHLQNSTEGSDIASFPLSFHWNRMLQGRGRL